jgi:hypothetical protein
MTRIEYIYLYTYEYSGMSYTICLPFIQTQSKPTAYVLHFVGTQFARQPGEACFCTT